MTDIIFIDSSKDVIDKINQLGVEWLEEASGELQEQTKRNTRVAEIDGGRTRDSWEREVITKKLEAYVGSRYINAVWEEFGTGINALKGNGRKDVPWFYIDEKTGKWHRTSGKKPSRAFWNAYLSLKGGIIKSALRKFGV